MLCECVFGVAAVVAHLVMWASEAFYAKVFALVYAPHTIQKQNGEKCVCLFVFECSFARWRHFCAWNHWKISRAIDTGITQNIFDSFRLFRRFVGLMRLLLVYSASSFRDCISFEHGECVMMHMVCLAWPIRKLKQTNKRGKSRTFGAKFKRKHEIDSFKWFLRLKRSKQENSI